MPGLFSDWQNMTFAFKNHDQHRDGNKPATFEKRIIQNVKTRQNKKKIADK